jgi:hypothetical protein
MDLDFTTDASQSKYLSKRGVYLLEVTEYKWSNDIEGYNKTPFIRFITKDTAGAGITSFTLWMPTANDSQKKSDIKKKILKEFLDNLGCDLTKLKGKDLLDCTIGKSCKVALREKERVIRRKKDDKPMVVTDLDYYYSGAADKQLKTDESKMTFPLTEKMRQDFNVILQEWNTANGVTDTPAPTNNFANDSAVSDEDWPF